MRRGAWVIIISLLLLALPVTGCGKGIKPLSDTEKSELIQAALRTSEASAEFIRNNGVYEAEFMWTKVVQRFSSYEGKITIGKDTLTDAELLESKDKPETSKPLAIYPTVLLKFGDSQNKQVRVVIDRETKKALFDETFVKYGSNAHIPSQQDAIVAAEWSSGLGGTWTYMFIYKNGSATYIEERGWRHPGLSGPPLSIKKTGKISAEELGRLSELFNNVVYEGKDRFFKLPPAIGVVLPEKNVIDHDAKSKMIHTDGFCRTDYHGDDLTKRIVANYNPFFHDYMSFTDVSNDVKNIYRQLKYIADYKTIVTEYRFVVTKQ